MSYGNVWDDGYPSGGNYWSDYTCVDLCSGHFQNETGSDGIGDIPYIIDSNNRDNYPLMKPYPWASHDVGITSVTTSKTIVGQGYNMPISIMAFNYGNYTENINITIYANTTIIGEINNIDIASRNFTIATFIWNTAGFAKGNYTISAYAWPVPGETHTSDNRLTCQVRVVIPGDFNGDGIVNTIDIYTELVLHFMRKRGEPGYSANSDINNDGIINFQDIYITIIHFMQTEP